MDEQFKNVKLPWALQRELAKALERPSWESTNEGIHERVNFDDTIWGFNIAGGAFYKTPLRITQVKENSRAEHAGIKVGDVLRSVNDIETSTLTVQQAHDMILASGLEIKLQLSAPDVDETTHYVYQDSWEDELREMNRLRELKRQQERKKFTGARVNATWDCAWPCNKKRDVLYRESNCFLVSSKFENTHPDRINIFKEKMKKDKEITKECGDTGVEDETKLGYDDATKNIESKVLSSDKKGISEYENFKIGKQEIDETEEQKNNINDADIADVKGKYDSDESRTEFYEDELEDDENSSSIYIQKNQEVNLEIGNDELSKNYLDKEEVEDEQQEGVQEEVEGEQKEIEEEQKEEVEEEQNEEREEDAEEGLNEEEVEEQQQEEEEVEDEQEEMEEEEEEEQEEEEKQTELVEKISTKDMLSEEELIIVLAHALVRGEDNVEDIYNVNKNLI